MGFYTSDVECNQWVPADRCAQTGGATYYPAVPFMSLSPPAHRGKLPYIALFFISRAEPEIGSEVVQQCIFATEQAFQQSIRALAAPIDLTTAVHKTMHNMMANGGAAPRALLIAGSNQAEDFVIGSQFGRVLIEPFAVSVRHVSVRATFLVLPPSP